MAERRHLCNGSQNLRGRRNNDGGLQRLPLSTSSLSSPVSTSSSGLDVVGSTSGHVSAGQPDDNNDLMMSSFSSRGLNMLQGNSAQLMVGSESTMNDSSNTTITTSSRISTEGVAYSNGQASSGYVLNGMVDESGNVLFETVEAEMGPQGQFFQPHSQSHNAQHQHQQLVETSLNLPSSEMSSTRVIGSQCLNMLNLQSAISNVQSEANTSNIVNSNSNGSGINVDSSTAAGLIQVLSAVNREMSHPQSATRTQNIINDNVSFSGINVQTSSAAGLIQALSAANREMSSSSRFQSLLPACASQQESSTTSMENSGQDLVAFNPALSDDPEESTANTAQVFLTQQHHHHHNNHQQQPQILNIMLERGTPVGNSSIISNTPSVNLHHRRRETAIDHISVTPEDNITSASISPREEVMSGLGQSNSIVTVSLNQQLHQHEEEQQQQHEQHQQYEQHQQLWLHQSDQGRLLSSRGGFSGDQGICQLPAAADNSSVQDIQQKAQLSEVSDSFQPLRSHPGNSTTSCNFQDMHSQFTGMFSEPQQPAYHVTAAPSSSSYSPPSPGDRPPPYSVITGDSEAAPSNPGPSQHQHVIVENETVDSSSLQPGQFTLVFDTGSQTLQLQRMTSPGDCSVSQSVLSLEGSEAQPSTSHAHLNHRGRRTAASTLTCGNSSQEVTTSTMSPQLRHMSDRAGPSRVDSSYSGRRCETSANTTSSLTSVMLKLEKPDGESVAECDTTQEDIEGFDHETAATSSNNDEGPDELHSTVLQPNLPRSCVVEVAMDTTLDSNNLTSLQPDAVDTSREFIQLGPSAETLGSIGSANDQEASQSGHLSSHLTDTASVIATTSKQGAQSVRKSRRLELVAQESKVSLKKRNYKSKQYDPTMLWCEDCMDAFSDQCPVHRLTAVPDKIVLSRAWASCPNQIQICRLPEAQLAPGESSVGVFTRRQIPKFTQFGPFLGTLVDALDKVKRQIFPLMLDLPHKPRQYFETSDENHCNWMMFVRPARTFAEQNLVAYQHKRNVFFSSTKMIEPKQELKVWYAAPYAEQMGVKTLELTEDDIQALDEAGGRFACSECSRRFRSWAALQRHLSTHEEEELEEEKKDNQLAQLEDYALAEAEEDTEFLPGVKESTGRQVSSGTAGQQKTTRANRRGRFRRGRKRMNVGEGSRKKTTFLAKTLKKYKRAQHQRPCSDSVLQTMKGMYRRQGKLTGGNEWMCTHCDLTFDNASLLNLHTLTHAAEDVGMEEIRKLAVPQAVEASSEVCATLTAVPPQASPDPSGSPAADGILQPLLPVSNFNMAEEESKPVLIVACPKCNVVFNDHKDLMDHVSTHAQKPQAKDGRPFCCSHCSKSFSTSEKLAKHQMVHGDDSQKPLECPVCFKRIMTNSAMACHMKTHSDRKYFDCPICDTDFDTGAQLREHAQISHADQNGQFPCKECAKVFDEFAMLKKHVRAFHSNKTFQCQECSKVFPRLDKLRLHMLRHTSHREFMCETCGRQFKRKDKLREHMKRVHDGRERQDQVNGVVIGEPQVVTTTKFTPKVMPSEYHRFIYKCHTCLLGFKRRGMLVNHLAKRHPEIRPEQVPELNLPILKTQKDFYCQYCEKIYKSASKRKMHIQKAHPGCAVPPSSRKKLSSVSDGGDACAAVSLANGFNNSSFSHTVSSITTMPHGCKFCHKQYASRTKLIQHQRKQHPEIAEPQTISRRKITKTDPDLLHIAVAGEERYEPVLPITVVNQGGDATNLQATDLLNLAMSELNYSGAGSVASLASLISSLGGGASAASPAGGGGAMVHIQSNAGQLQPATIDLSQLSQLNQALQSFSVTGQGATTTVLQTPLSPSQHSQHQHPQPHLPHHEQQQQIQLQQQQVHPQSQQQQQQLTVVTPSGSQTINLSTGSQFIARAWPANFAAQSFR